MPACFQGDSDTWWRPIYSAVKNRATRACGFSIQSLHPDDALQPRGNRPRPVHRLGTSELWCTPLTMREEQNCMWTGCQFFRCDFATIQSPIVDLIILRWGPNH